MPTIFTHPAVPLAIGIGLGTRVIPPKLLIMGALATIVPDVDVYFGATVQENSALAHRGFTHSVGFAFLVGLLAAALARRALAAQPLIAFAFVTLCTASHGLLDAFTNGEAAVMLLWPFSHERYLMPWEPIEISPIGLRGLVSFRMIEVLLSEVKWVGLPAAALTYIIYKARRLRET